MVETHFGQGLVRSKVHYDSVALKGISSPDANVPNQSVLLMVNNELRGFNEASYDAVMGLGMQEIARNNDSDLSLLSSLHSSVVSVCYGQLDGENGTMIVGGGHAGLDYFELPVTGSLHWAVDMGKVAVGTKSAGCDGGSGCSAILDSGTSLIAAPAAQLETILSLIGEVKQDCSNVKDLPTIHLQLGDHTVELPPEVRPPARGAGCVCARCPPVLFFAIGARVRDGAPHTRRRSMLRS